MSIALMTEVWRLDMPTTDKMVLLALADAANDDGVTWIAVASRKATTKLDLLKKTNLSERAVQGALKRLVESGHLTREDRMGKGTIWTITPAGNAPPHLLPPAPTAPRTTCAPADNDTNPRSRCGETVSNHQPTSEAKASSVVTREPKAKASRRCPADWSPRPADLAVAEGEGFTPGEIERELASIRDCEFRNARSDWSATFRNWIRREAKNRRPRNDRPDKLAAKQENLARGWSSPDRAAEIVASRRAL